MSYSPPLAATLSGATIRQLSYWRRPSPSGPPLLVPDHHFGRRIFYSFEDVVALRMFVKLREEISLQRIRRGVAWLTQNHPETHMSKHALQAIPEERTIVWISSEGDYFDIVTRPGEQGFAVVMESIFRAFETDRGVKVPDLAEPTPGITIDPRVRGGFPVIENSRIPYSVIAGLVNDGLRNDEIQMLYPQVTPESAGGAHDFDALVALARGEHRAA